MGLHPGVVTARFVDFNSDEGYKEWTGRGLSCGEIFVNDSDTFTLTKDGREVPVAFQKAPSMGNWAEEDLGLVVEQVLKAAQAGGQ